MDESPVSIKASKTKKELTVEWKDGHHSVYPFWLLRAACPCATCRGGHENMSPEPDPKVFQHFREDSAENRLTRLEMVGQYAITFEWEDGHHFGIYTWHYLRALCPCNECRNSS
ncbi:gamma-butyrobetaine hydroxylase-like domain-containing protein [Anaerolinea thermolimosa]|uniref:gamma-butyrobetaine hydroxylase-like domain-containing protein n=1 Tax=Anaerolinea thermolimosa TaxID=229919 RepID=UPI000A054B97|nr:DUF971 domain-containing protein [Anaerolinea thermolimosa]